MLNTKILKRYWLNNANKYLAWDKRPKTSLTKNNNYLNWFPDGKINLYENCILKNLKKFPKKIAIIALDKDKNIKKYNFQQINNLVLEFERKFFFNLKKKQRVVVHASSSIESAISMLACIKNGFHFCVIFEELENISIKKRIKIFKPSLIFTYYPNRFKNKKKIRIENFNKFNFRAKAVRYKNSNILYFESNKSLFTLFTSGTTGEPKGVVHSTGGYALYTLTTCKKQFGIKEESIILTASDAGWINGHTYSLIGPLLLGATTVLIYKPTLLLDLKILKKVLNLKITILYLPVTLIRILRSLHKNIKFKNKYLKTLGSMGEPLAHDVGSWFSKAFSLEKKSIINTYYQTETCGIICSPSFKDSSTKFPPGSVGMPINKYIKISKLGKKKKEFKIKSVWPGCMKKLLNGDKEYQKYWDRDGNFRMFDLATKTNKGIYIHGRVDDVINIRGHRIGSEEIETVLLRNKYIVEVAAIAVKDLLEGMCIYIYLNSKKKVTNEIENSLMANFGTFALPRKIIYLNELPKTRSGKILRRILKKISENPSQKLNIDMSTVLNKSAIKEVIEKLNE